MDRKFVELFRAVCRKLNVLEKNIEVIICHLLFNINKLNGDCKWINKLKRICCFLPIILYAKFPYEI